MKVNEGARVGRHMTGHFDTSQRMAPFARDLGNTGEPFGWDPARLALIQAAADALMMHVFGLTRVETEHDLDSFPVLRKYEERGHGEFRTSRLVPEFYERINSSINAGLSFVRAKGSPVRV